MNALSLASKKKQIRILFGTGVAHGINIALGELDEAGLDELLNNGDNARAKTIEFITKTARELSVTNLFAAEEVVSKFKYPKEYKGPKPISTQVDILAGLYSLSLGYTSEFLNKALPTLSLPEGAEGWFAIPSVDAVAKVHFPDVKDPAERYVRCVLLALEKLAASRPFYNYRDGEITAEKLRRTLRTTHALDLIAEKQQGDIIVIPAQLGLRHRGRSVRRSRALFAGSEFGFGAWEVINIALTHPERLVTYEELDMDCAGDEFDPGPGDGFSGSPFVDFNDGGVGFGTEWFDDANGIFGTVSGFVPQE